MVCACLLSVGVTEFIFIQNKYQNVSNLNEIIPTSRLVQKGNRNEASSSLHPKAGSPSDDLISPLRFERSG